MQLTVDDATLITQLVQDLCGVVLDSTKGYLIEHRLAPVAQEFQCRSYNDLYRRVRLGTETALVNRVIEAITTNETSFFRDRSPFEALAHRVLPDIIDGLGANPERQGLRLWSAAASTGQEAYSLAITLRQVLPDPDRWNAQVIGTDISESALVQARAGRYPAREARRGLTEEDLSEWFTRDHDEYVVCPEIKRMVSFRRHNLLEPFSHLGPFDIAFCRNVGIYFDDPTKHSLFQRVSDVIRGTGYVFGSSSEYLDSYCQKLQLQRHSGAIYYRKNG